MNKSMWIEPLPLACILRREWMTWLTLAIFSFFGASLLMSGFPNGLIPNVEYPFVYAGDGLSHSWMAQRVIEGWIFENPRNGFPFGSDFRDYPGSDSGNLIILKILGVLGLAYQGAFNVFFLLTFSFVAISSYLVARTFGVNKTWACCGALIYAFASFHFQRLAHIFYASYFVAPFFFYLCGVIYFSSNNLSLKKLTVRGLLLFSIFLIALSSFGVYYALFGVIILSLSTAAAVIKYRNLRALWVGAGMIFFICAGVLLNVLPNIVHKFENGENIEVAQRSPVEADIYGFKPVQLFLPQLGHRAASFDSIANKYASVYSVNENHTSNLGLIGSIGLIIIFISSLSKIVGRSVDDRIILFSFTGLVIISFGVSGGAGTIFSALISSSIRGWNRISIFLLFAAIFSFIFLAQKTFNFNAQFKGRVVSLLAALGVVFLGFYDQTQAACVGCQAHIARVFSIDKKFYEDIEKYVGEGGAVYQLPYIPFPESPVVNGISPYDLLVGFLHTDKVRWSSGGMKGRQGDLFYRSLSMESVEKQVEIIKKLGFRGVYIDKRAYSDFGEKIIMEFTRVLGAPPVFEREFGEVVFFGIENVEKISFEGKTAQEIMFHANFVVDHLGVRTDASPEDAIDFSQGRWPSFIKDVKGLSVVENWGRWSDAKLNPSVVFDLHDDLPSSFSLELKVSPYGKNGFQDVVVKIGGIENTFRITKPREDIIIPFKDIPKQVRKIEFIPVEPVSPKEVGGGDDSRKLGIGFIEMKFGSI